MEYIKTGFIIFSAVYLLILSVIMVMTKKPLKILLFNLFVTVWVFLIVNLTTFYTSVHIPVNYGTAGVITFGGLPGAVLLILIKSYFIP